MPHPRELDKMLAVQDKSQAIGEFLEWLQHEKGIILCKDDEDHFYHYYPVHISTEKLLAEFFDIDLNKCDREKRQILEELRSKQCPKKEVPGTPTKL